MNRANRSVRLMAWVGAGLTVGALACSSADALTFVDTRAGLGGNDSIVWSTIGAEFSNPANPTSSVTGGLLGYTVSMGTGSSFWMLRQSSSWAGNFTPGDFVLFTNFNNTAITIDFASPVLGVGTQIMRNEFGPFAGTIDAYDATNKLLGTFTMPGSANGNADGTALFLGVSDGTADIKRIVLSVAPDGSPNVEGFAINDVSILRPTSQPPQVGVPEPITASAAAIGLLAVAASATRRRKM